MCRLLCVFSCLVAGAVCTLQAEIGVRRSKRKSSLEIEQNGRVLGLHGMESLARGGGDNHTGAAKQTLEPGAVFAAIVQSPDHYGDKHNQNMAGDAARFLCSARRLGSTLPFHLIYGGGVSDRDLAVLRTLGWHIDDHKGDVDYWKSNYNPLYNESMAKKQKRRWRTDNNPTFVQKRKDGWCTYFKFHAWQATSYKHVLLSDLDVKFEKRPDDALAKLDAGVSLLANPEKAYRWYYDGLNTHMTILKPSNDTFRELVRKASTGDYLPFTNTEQDIIEDLFPPEKGHAKAMNGLIQHRHGSFAFPNCTAEWAKAVLNAESPSCDDMYKLCPEQ